MFLANFLIALREGVEAALIVGILVAYLHKVNRRDLLPRLWVGVVIAAVVPLACGAFMTWGPYTLTFQAQEILGGSLSIVAVAMITWMIMWMGKNSRRMSQELREKAESSLERDTSGWGVVWIAVISVGREGIETALFVWATVKATANGGVWQPTLGVVTGLIAAIVVGWLIYRGTSVINLKLFFRITGALLVFVAAGVLSYGIGDLQEASVLPGWGVPIYDLTPYFDGHIWGLDTTSWWFVLLEAMFQLNLAPTYLQFFGWFAFLVIVLPLFLWRTRVPSAPAAHGASQAPSHAADADSRAAATAEAGAAGQEPTLKERS